MLIAEMQRDGRFSTAREKLARFVLEITARIQKQEEEFGHLPGIRLGNWLGPLQGSTPNNQPPPCL